MRDKELHSLVVKQKLWDKAIEHHVRQKAPPFVLEPDLDDEQVKAAKKSREAKIRNEVNTIWERNRGYARDDLTGLVLLADTLPAKKRQELFTQKAIVDFVKSLLGAHSTFINEAERIKVVLAERKKEFSVWAQWYHNTRSAMHRRSENIVIFESVTREKIFRPRSEEMQQLQDQIKAIEDDAAAWKKGIMEQAPLAEIAAAISKECLDYCLKYYVENVTDPGMERYLTDSFTNTKMQLDSIIRQVKEKKEKEA